MPSPESVDDIDVLTHRSRKRRKASPVLASQAARAPTARLPLLLLLKRLSRRLRED